MDAKITLSFDADVIQKAKAYAEKNNISLSRLMEHLLRKVATGSYANLEDLPISDWVNMVSEGEVEYKTTRDNRKNRKKEYHERRK